MKYLVRSTSSPLVVALLLLMRTSEAWAATYYVSESGRSSNPGTEERPWGSPGDCLEKMAGGDTCYIMDGIYVAPASGKASRPGWNFCERNLSGTEDNPTVIAGAPGHRPVINRLGKDSAIGVTRLDSGNFTCKHFEFSNMDVVGGVTVRSSGNYATQDVTIKDVVMDGGAFDCDGNWSQLRIEDTRRVTVENVLLENWSGAGCSGGTASSANVKEFCVSQQVIRNTTFDCRGGKPSEPLDDKDTSFENEYHNLEFIECGSQAIRLGHQKRCSDPMADVLIEDSAFLGDSGIRLLKEVDGVEIVRLSFETGGIEARTSGDGMPDVKISNIRIGAGGEFRIADGHQRHVDTWDVNDNCYHPQTSFRWGSTSLSFGEWRSRLQSEGCRECESRSRVMEDCPNPIQGCVGYECEDDDPDPEPDPVDCDNIPEVLDEFLSRTCPQYEQCTGQICAQQNEELARIRSEVCE